jgi:hypothetical protein
MLVPTPLAQGVALTASEVVCEWPPNCAEIGRNVRHPMVWSEVELVNVLEANSGCQSGVQCGMFGGGGRRCGMGLRAGDLNERAVAFVKCTSNLFGVRGGRCYGQEALGVAYGNVLCVVTRPCITRSLSS